MPYNGDRVKKCQRQLVSSAILSSDSASLHWLGINRGAIQCGLGLIRQRLPIVSWSSPSGGLELRFGFLHITDDGLPTVVHMDVLDTDKLLPAVTQRSEEHTSELQSPA